MSDISERDGFVRGIMTTAAEGGINYWAEVLVQQRKGIWVTSMFLKDLESGDRHEVTTETVEKGLDLVRSGSVKVGSDILRHVLAGDADDDAGEIDVEGADVIVQAGLFGKLIYG